MPHAHTPADTGFSAALARRDERALVREAHKIRQPQRLHHHIRMCLAQQWWRGADRLWARLETSHENAVRAALLAVLDRRGNVSEQTAVLDWALEKMHCAVRADRKHTMQEAILQAALHTGHQACWERTLRAMGRLRGPFDTFQALARRGADPVATWVHAHAREGSLERVQAGSSLICWQKDQPILRTLESVRDLDRQAGPAMEDLVVPWAGRAVEDLLQAGAHPTTEQVLQAGLNGRMALLLRYLEVEDPSYTEADLAGLACGLGTARHVPARDRGQVLARLMEWGVSDVMRLPARKPCLMWSFDRPARRSYMKDTPSLIISLRMPSESGFDAETCCSEALSKVEGCDEVQVDVALWWSQGALHEDPKNTNAQASQYASFRSRSRANQLKQAWAEPSCPPVQRKGRL